MCFFFFISVECSILFYLIVHLLGKRLLSQTYILDFPAPWLSVSSVPNLAYSLAQLKTLEQNLSGWKFKSLRECEIFTHLVNLLLKKPQSLHNNQCAGMPDDRSILSLEMNNHTVVNDLNAI